MFRFSCFHSPLHSQKSKKTVHLSTESMQKTFEDYSANRPKKDSKEAPECVSSGNDTNLSSSSVVQDWKSEGLTSVNDAESNDEARNVRQMRKSLSLGSGLVHYNGMSSGDESCSSHNDRSWSGSGVRVDDTEPATFEDQKDPAADSLQPSSIMVNHESVNQESIFSPEYAQKSDKEVCAGSESRFSEEGTCDLSNHMPRTPHAIVKSTSLPILHSRGNLLHQSRSSEDLKVLVLRRKDLSVDKSESRMKQDEERDGVVDDNEGDLGKNNAENPVDDSYYAYDYGGSAKEWIVPAVDEKNVQEDRSVSWWDDLPGKEFKIKRIEKWVMDLQHCSSLEQIDRQITNFDDHGQNGINAVLDGGPASRIDSKVLLGMDAAKRYISSLSGFATAAQLANHGLVAIPFMSAFTSLRALNLSGNAIVRITAGALPRGLHILNLSKNNISTIEGLRELSRLRVLDLSYNRILRIGHGLASCSSLKEVYLAGNKISEVEGLHRLLKLNVLDLRFNKLSTTKNLGQLAANYNSLQAISLEGNPAQKNIGDEQLKKYLIGLLPHLAYVNRQLIKAGSVKDSADRAARLGISAHQIDHRGGLRSELKNLGKSTHGRKSQPAAAVTARGRHGRLPPSGLKTDRVHGRDLSSKLLSFRPDLAIRRTHSEGLLRAV